MNPQGEGRIRVMLVDDHRIVLWGMERLIEGERPMMEVVATATTCEGAIELAQTSTPDVVVLDVDLLREDKGETIPALANSRVLILSGARDGKLQGGFALPLESYPPAVWRQFMFENHKSAAAIGVRPNPVAGPAAAQLYDIVVNARERRMR